MATEAKTTVVEKTTDKPVEIKKEEKVEDIKPVEVMDTVQVAVKLKSINVKLPEEIHRKLKAKVALEGENTGNVLKRLIDEYLK